MGGDLQNTSCPPATSPQGTLREGDTFFGLAEILGGGQVELWGGQFTVLHCNVRLVPSRDGSGDGDDDQPFLKRILADICKFMTYSESECGIDT